MLWTAAGVSRSTYYNKQSEFFTPDHLVAIATEFGINPIWLLAYYEVISDVHVIEYAERELGMVRTSATAARVKKSRGGNRSWCNSAWCVRSNQALTGA